jgi:RimJ/RimL family protein N-acetyltransferase
LIDFKKNISLRYVVLGDEKLLFEWANDTEVRKWSNDKNPIKLNNHKVWLRQKLSDANVLMWIIEYNRRPAGMVRLEKESDNIELHYLIEPKSRGKGLASKMVELALNEASTYWKIIRVFAHTLPGNVASIKSLKKAGFFCAYSNNEKNCYVHIVKPGIQST